MDRYNGDGCICNTDPDFNKKVLLQILSDWKSEYYRRGMIQCAVIFNIINMAEWEHLNSLIKNKEQCYLDFKD